MNKHPPQIHLSTAIILMFVTALLIPVGIKLSAVFTWKSDKVTLGLISIDTAMVKVGVMFAYIGMFILLMLLWYFCEWRIECQEEQKKIQNVIKAQLDSSKKIKITEGEKFHEW